MTFLLFVAGFGLNAETMSNDNVSSTKETTSHKEMATFAGYISNRESVTFTKLANHTDVTAEGTYMIVDVNGGYHEAVPSDQLTAEDKIFDFKAAAENTSSSYKVNPQNATQLTYGDRIYQVTEETVPTRKELLFAPLKSGNAVWLIIFSTILIAAKTIALREAENPAYVIAMLLLSPIIIDIFKTKQLPHSPMSLSVIIFLGLLLWLVG